MAAPLKFVDRPRAGRKIATVILLGVAACLLSWVLAHPPLQPRGNWVAGGIFLFGLVAMAREFLFRPLRVTTIHPDRLVIVIEETSPLRERRIVAAITTTTRFEISSRDGDNLSYEVRLLTKEHGWLRVMAYVSTNEAEDIARRANAGLAQATGL